MKHIISVGGGITSALLLPLYIKHHYPNDELQLVMAKLPNEHPDVKRLCDAAEGLIGVDITYIGTGEHPFDAFKQARFLGNTRVDPCSRILKREAIRAWLKENYTTGDIVHVGIAADEMDRMVTIKERWKQIGVNVSAPLMNCPHITRRTQLFLAKNLLGWVPEMYLHGFVHHNCHGACIKAGHRQWALLLLVYPTVYAEWEQKEEEFRQWIDKDVSILRNWRQNESNTYTLRTFREEIEDAGATSIAKLKRIGFYKLLSEAPGCSFCSAM